MSRLDGVRAWLDQRFADLVAAHQVPGAQAAVLAGDEVVDAGAGVLNRNTGVEVTTDSVFQIGSATKLWTATLVLQLVDEGKLDLDVPVQAYLPEFRVADPRASAEITARQLLSHTAGFEGNLYARTTRDDDAVQRLVEDLVPTLAQLSPPGHRFSYCNAGYCVLGRLVEVMRGMPYPQALRAQLADPLGLAHVATRVEEAILFRASVGHLRRSPELGWTPAPVWTACHGEAPAGATLAMPARELLGLVRMHLRGGLAPDGTRLLSAASVRAMQQPQADLPPLTAHPGWYGLGWYLAEPPGGRVIAQNGGALGQAAFLRVVPERGVAVALVTNGGKSNQLSRAVIGHLLGELAGIDRSEEPLPLPAEPLPIPDPARYVGRYQARVASAEVRADTDGRLWVTYQRRLAEITDEVTGMLGTGAMTGELVRVRGDTFVVPSPTGGVGMVCAFVGDDGRGRAAFLHKGSALPRVA